MITFNPGPSQLSAETKADLKKAVDLQIAEFSHRSGKFSAFSEKTILGLRKFFNIPDSYKVFYTSSATDAIQLSIANCCEKKSFHFINGNFSKLFSKVAKGYYKDVNTDEVESGQQNDYANKEIPADTDFISITHNETSTGVMCNMEDITAVRQKYPEATLAVDITSSAGATEIDILEADIWLYSVQKCFGLPSGLGIFIVSEKAFNKSLELSEKGVNLGCNFTLANMWKKMEGKYQTLCTPNCLDIYLLGEVTERWNQKGGLTQNIQDTNEKFDFLNNFFASTSEITHCVLEEQYRSRTVLSMAAPESTITAIHEACKQNEIILGKGFGPLKPTAFRIANFPALSLADMKRLTEVIKSAL